MFAVETRIEEATKKPPEGGFFVRKQKITSSRGLQVQQPVRQRERLQVPKRQQQEREPELEQRREREQERGPEPALSYRKQPEQLRRRWLPERETCSFFGSLMNEKNIFHFAEDPGR